MIAQPASRLTDDELVARIRGGDDAAFSEIDHRYRSVLTAFARRIVHGCGQDPEDVVQDAFIRAYRGLRVTDRAIALRPWLFMIVRNRALDARRTPQRSRAYDDEVQMHAVGDGDPARRFAESEEMRQVVAEIARLPERQRMALVLRELDGRSHVETARALATTVPATKSLIVRARSNLHAAVHAA